MSQAHDELLELQSRHDTVFADLERLKLRERIAERERMLAGQEQAQANRLRHEKAQELQEIEAAISAARRALDTAGPGPNLVTDRAVVTWLDRIEGFDIRGIREKILSAVSEATLETQEGEMRFYRIRGCRVVVRGGQVVAVIE